MVLCCEFVAKAALMALAITEHFWHRARLPLFLMLALLEQVNWGGEEAGMGHSWLNLAGGILHTV